jgi:hypothetical protein
MSFSDGDAAATSKQKRSSGVPYFLMTGLDETPQDLAANASGSFAVSEMQIAGDKMCRNVSAEDPTCARVVLSGNFVDLTATNSSEADVGLQFLYSKHPDMKAWGKPGAGVHAFHVWKLVIQSIFVLDFYGGSKPITVEEYYDADPTSHLADPTAAAGPGLVGCGGHEENHVMMYYGNASACTEGNRAFNHHLLKDGEQFAGCLDHYAGIPFFQSERSCALGSRAVSGLLSGPNLAGCTRSRSQLEPRYYPTFKSHEQCVEALPQLNAWLGRHQ